MELIHLWLNYNGQPMMYARLVTIHDSSQVWVESNKFKADKIILGDRQLISDLDIWRDVTYCLATVKQYDPALKYVSTQTPEICRAAIQQHAWVLPFIFI